MTTMPVRPELLPAAGALDAAIQRSELNYEEIGRRIGMAGASIRNYRGGRMGVRPAIAAKLGELLDVDPATLVSSSARAGGAAKRKKKPPGRKPSGKQSKPGPAARAVALLARAAPAMAEVRAAPPTAPVFRMELRADGAMAIDVRAILDMKRGGELVRYLLDFGLLPDADAG